MNHVMDEQAGGLVQISVCWNNQFTEYIIP